MGIREKLNENPAITTVATATIVVIAIGFIVWQLMPGGNSTPTKAFYSDDDGASYYKDDINLIAPYDHNGKEAVKAIVFKCPSSGAFVAYLEKYSPEAKRAMEAAKNRPQTSGPGPTFNPAMDAVMMNGRLAKAPGAGHRWVYPRDPEYVKIVEPKCPDGSSDVETVNP